MTTDCLFCKIIRGDIPSRKVYEDEYVLAILDITPINNGHTLVISKNHSSDFVEMDDGDIPKVFSVAKKVGQRIIDNLGATGFNLQINNHPEPGHIFHTHTHIIPRFENDGLKLWSGKPYVDGEADKYLELLKF